MYVTRSFRLTKSTAVLSGSVIFAGNFPALKTYWLKALKRSFWLGKKIEFSDWWVLQCILGFIGPSVFVEDRGARRCEIINESFVRAMMIFVGKQRCAVILESKQISNILSVKRQSGNPGGSSLAESVRLEWQLPVQVLCSTVPKKAARQVLYLHYGCLMLVKEL